MCGGLVWRAAVIMSAVAATKPPFIGWYMNAQGSNVMENVARLDKERVTHVFMADRKPTVSKAWDFECRIPRRGAVSGSWHGVSAEESFFPAVREVADEYGFKVMLMLGGWGGSNYYSYCLQPENRKVFIDSIVDYLVENGLDGVDFDYEHPGLGGPCDHDDVWPEIMTVRQCDAGEDMKFGVNCKPGPSGDVDERCCTRSGWMCVPEQPTRGFCWWSQGVPKTSPWGDASETPDDSMCDFVNHIGDKFRGHYTNDWTAFIETIEETREALQKVSYDGGMDFEVTAAIGVSGMWEGCEGRVDGRDAYDQYQGTAAGTMRGGSVPCDRPDIPRLCAALDHLGLMVYDVWGTQYPFTDHHAPFHCDARSPMHQLRNFPFTPGDGFPCYPRYTMQTAVDWLLNPFEPENSTKPDGSPHTASVFTGGCPAEKVTVGMPAYGKGVCGVPAGSDPELPGLFQTFTPGTKCPDDVPGGWSWANVSSHGYFAGPMGEESGDNDGDYHEERRGFYTHRNEDGELVGRYWYDHDNEFFMTVDTPDVVKQKAAWLRERGVAGYFFWEGTLDNWAHDIGEAAYVGWTGRSDPNEGNPVIVSTGVDVALAGGALATLGASVVLFTSTFMPLYAFGFGLCGIVAMVGGMLASAVVFSDTDNSAGAQWNGEQITGYSTTAVATLSVFSCLLGIAAVWRLFKNKKSKNKRESQISESDSSTSSSS